MGFQFSERKENFGPLSLSLQDFELCPMHFLVMFPRELSVCVFILPMAGRECREEKKEVHEDSEFPAGKCYVCSFSGPVFLEV